jgi:predicted dehydrogenase
LWQNVNLLAEDRRMAPKRIGLIGAGWVTQHHLAGYRALGPERVRVVAIADPNEAARQRRAAEFGIPATHADAAEMLEREQLDAVDIAAPREFHAPMCLLAARRNLPILCQKPLTPTLAESEALVREIGGRVRLMVHENCASGRISAPSGAGSTKAASASCARRS